METDGGESRKRKGLFSAYLRNCLTECPRMEAKITGTIPEWLKGSLIRNGPGLYKIGSQEYSHLFDYPSLLRKFSIENGRVFYENKFLESSTFKKNQKHQRIIVQGLCTIRVPDPCKTLLQRFMSYFTIDDPFSDNNTVTFTKVNDEIYAVSDSPYLLKVDPENLQTLETIDIRKQISVNCLTSHAHTDDEGNVYNMGNTLGYYNIIKIEPKTGLEKVLVAARIPIARPFNPSYYHSFAMTENYFVFIEQPFVVSVAVYMSHVLFGGPQIDIMKWKPEYKNRFYLISRKDGTLVNQKYISEPFAFFHTINAFEEKNHVVVDICCYNNGYMLEAMYTDSIKETEIRRSAEYRDAAYVTSQPRRFVLPILGTTNEIKVGQNVNSLPDSKAVAVFMKNTAILCIPEALTKEISGVIEMPTIHYSRYNGRNYRYFYCISYCIDNELHQLIKCDTKTKNAQIWFEVNYYVSEPIFVPSPNSVDEDDGVILSSVVSQIEENEGFLLVLDAKTFKELGRASVTTPSALPSDFHGCFLSK